MSKAQRAAEAVAANSQKSNRAIAEEVGVDEGTMRATRRATAEHSAVDDEPRRGLDGKSRRMPTRTTSEIDEDSPSLHRSEMTRWANSGHSRLASECYARPTFRALFSMPETAL